MYSKDHENVRYIVESGTGWDGNGKKWGGSRKWDGNGEKWVGNGKMMREVREVGFSGYKWN